VEGLFDKMLAFLDHMVAERFLKPEHRALLLVAEDTEVLIEAMQAFTPPDAGKWLDRVAGEMR
jgi:predicted Rossmann-fold nucleotide-binding protein